MTKQQECSTCRWFDDDAERTGMVHDESMPGVCRRYPPKPNAVDPDEDTCVGTWPLVYVNEFCGEWAAKGGK